MRLSWKGLKAGYLDDVPVASAHGMAVSDWTACRLSGSENARIFSSGERRRRMADRLTAHQIGISGTT